MCGIAGYLHLDLTQRVNPSALAAMNQSLKHRGPDDAGEWSDGPVALGHRRLSIIDLSASGHQPMSNEDGTVWIVFNGEIYNFNEYVAELQTKGHRFKSKTDTEVILHLYEEYGIDCLRKLNGMFAFALWDRKRQELFLARDPMGIKPLHYAESNGQFVFASEIKSILEYPGISRQIDLDAVNQYASFDYVPAPRSIFRGIKKLLPAHYLHVKNGITRTVSYWKPPYENQAVHQREADYVDELHHLLKESVKRHLIADVPLGAFLSGGVDSSMICALMQELVLGQVKTFHIGFEDPSFDESRYARQVADYLGTQHHSQVLSPSQALHLIPNLMEYLDEPFADASFIPTLLLSKFAKEHVQVSLSGDGGDELFAGYPTYQAHSIAALHDMMPAWLQRTAKMLVARLPVSDADLSMDFRLKKFMAGVHEPSPIRRNQTWLGSFGHTEKSALFSEAVLSQLTEPNEYRVAEDYFNGCAAAELLEKILYCDQRFFLQDNMLVKIDRASMAVSLEGRVPYLDRTIAEFAARLPSAFKLRGLMTKYVLKKAAEKKLPASIIYRKKKGFSIPLARWFKGELKPLLTDMLEPSKLKREGIFNPAYVQQLLQDHFANRRDCRKELYNLLSFELWHARYSVRS